MNVYQLTSELLEMINNSPRACKGEVVIIAPGGEEFRIDGVRVAPVPWPEESAYAESLAQQSGPSDSESQRTESTLQT